MATPWRPTTIALDFDRTFTSDIDLWRFLIGAFTQRGHKVYLVTGRHDTPENRQLVYATLGDERLSLAGCAFCNHQPKRAVMEAAGVLVDIWIDDLPELVGNFEREVFDRLESAQPVAETLPVLAPQAVRPDSRWCPPPR